MNTKSFFRSALLMTGLVFATVVFNTKNASSQKNTAAVMGIKSSGIIYGASQCVDLARLEFLKLGLYDVMSSDDILPALNKAGINADSCFSKECIKHAGKTISADYILSGAIDRFSEKIVFSFRMIKIADGSTEKSQTIEFLNLQPELQNMMRLTLCKMFAQPFDEVEMKRLTEVTFDNQRNNPGITKLILQGPRMGIYLPAFGPAGKRLTEDERNGGFGLNRSLMSIFGYQKEIQYLNEGKFQALFEILPMIAGLDQGRFIPSINLLNGFRNNKSGWEIAFGPSLAITKLARGYYDGSNNWHWEGEDNYAKNIGNSKEIQTIDNRGTVNFDFAFVIAVGKTFRSGSMNLPVNMFCLTGKNDIGFGLTFGFNSKNNR